MLITERNFVIYKILNIYFAEEPVTVDVSDWDVITYHTYKNWGDIKGYEKDKIFTTIVDLSQDIDSIWQRIKRQHKRHIRRAEKNGVTITISNNYEGFYQINKKFLKQKNYTDPVGLNVLPPQFMQKYGILFIAETQGEIVGGTFYFHDKYNAYLVDNAYQIVEDTVENKKRSSDANCYLHWKAMQYFKNRGIVNYDLGDVSCEDIKINHHMTGAEYFKRCFGGDVIPRYEYRKFNSGLNKLLFDSWNFFRNT